MKLRPLDDVATFFSGFAWKANRFQDDPSGVPIIRIQNVGSNVQREFKYWPDAYDDRFIIVDGDLLLTLSGSFRTAVWNGPRALLNQRIVKVTAKSHVDRDWLFYALENAMSRIAGMGRHALVSNVALSDLKEMQIAVPPLEEQKRIAAILDQADALRRLRRRTLDRLNTLGQAIFHEMFSEGGAQESPTVTLGNYLLDVTNGMTRRAKGSEAQNDIVLRLKDVRDGYLDLSTPSRISLTDKEKKRHKIIAGDLLFIRVNGNPDNVGRNAVFEGHIEDVYHNDHVMRVRVDKSRIIPEYLSFVLNLPMGKRQIASNIKNSAGQHTINQTGLASLCIPMPALDLQEVFVSRIKEMRLAMDVGHAHQGMIEALFTSLQHRAFRGEL